MTDPTIALKEYLINIGLDGDADQYLLAKNAKCLVIPRRAGASNEG